MPGCDQENESADDSRTAAVGPRSNQRSNRITKPSSQFARARRSARNSRLGHQNPQDFVPQGATFTTTSLPIDEESGSSPTQSSDTSESDDSQAEPELTLVKPMPNERAQAAVNWNNVARGAIRTSLRGSGAISASIPGSFDTVNGAFWRSRSASVSDPGNANMVESKPRGLGIQISNGISDNQSHPIVVSDDSELETDADADNAILLNLSSSNQNASDINDTTQELRIKGASEPFANGLDDRREHDAVLDHQQTSLEAAAIHPQSSNAKVEAVETFHSRYPSAPYILGDLSNEDRDIQLHFIYYNANPEDVNLNLPIRCTDCMAEGHLAEVCPYKEVRIP
ncbi:hypothetical protein LOZ53_006062 [Ophidiomyces ophidiicola]|nr:hypothetical protein LOZ55_006342 [Ophidiomyces ophidiicola]KAI1982994.1 hypothetical protein LOZ53_006062 [Ophidiomyces ophidiicola]KAI1983146.1 hypothetical protein LOZ54_005058 [Ophidiomyces ophidiicola]KAI1996915.1 hypothetical protein LOZ51_003077 [Ophidiomyces ophidiicola]